MIASPLIKKLTRFKIIQVSLAFHFPLQKTAGQLSSLLYTGNAFLNVIDKN